jgi:hypothetical protein
MSESRKEAIKKFIEENNITAEDIRKMINTISKFYYYEIEINGKRASDVVIEVSPNPSDIKNLSSFIAAWKNLMTAVMKDIANTISSLMPQEERISYSDPNKLFQLLLRQKLSEQKKVEEEVPVLDIEEEDVESEKLKKSIEKVKKITEGEKKNEQTDKEKENN